MKFKKLSILMLSALALTSVDASAQYYEIANQIPNLITPALSGSMAYKGYVEAEYLHGVSNYSSDFVELSTSQGFRYANWFFMGAGLGVQYVHSNPGDFLDYPGPDAPQRSFTTNGVFIPIFTDFRFILGQQNKIGFFFDLRLGASFLANSDPLKIGNGYLTSSEFFYLRPSLGFRIPTNVKNPRQAFDIGVSYQLLTNNNWRSWPGNQTLNALGVNVAYEW